MIGVAYGSFRPCRIFRLEQDLSSSPEFLSHLIASYLFEDEKSTPQAKRLNLLDQGIDPYVRYCIGLQHRTMFVALCMDF